MGKFFLWNLSCRQDGLLQNFDHIKKGDKMPAFSCNYNDVDKLSTALQPNVPFFRFKGVTFLFFLCVLFSHDIGWCRAIMDSGRTFSTQVVKVIDGDTLEVRHLGEIVRVRMWGVDTPEWRQKFSHEAREFTRQGLDGRQVELRVMARDSFGRLVAMIMVDGKCFNEELVREGWAWVHIYYCKEPVCREWRKLEKNAKSTGRGLWQERNPMAPWKWKRIYK